MKMTGIVIAAALMVGASTNSHAKPTDREGARAAFAERFALADLNNDGLLDRTEAATLSPRLAKHFDRIDLNADQRLSQDELRQAWREKRAMRQMMRVRAEGMKMRFEALDRDGDGALTPIEIGDRMPRLRDNFIAIDTNQDGKLTIEEIRSYLKARIHAHHAEHKAR